ncbi:hypothetical protein M231_00196 [Tremella mesenterica]|uniref:Uncharacterized protein n=1 Tax=Tremella mesenterica TaxID=5217 RepID=A0A4Q1BWZ3_TREME|nr:hypothetical protein M231_00196 [Tremella mesenterica]
MSSPTKGLLNWVDNGTVKMLILRQPNDTEETINARRKALALHRSDEFLTHVETIDLDYVTSTDFFLVPADISVEPSNGIPRATVQINEYFVKRMPPDLSQLRFFDESTIKEEHKKQQCVGLVKDRANKILGEGFDFPVDEYSTKVMKEWSHVKASLCRLHSDYILPVGDSKVFCRLVGIIRYPGHASMLEPSEEELDWVRKQKQEAEAEAAKNEPDNRVRKSASSKIQEIATKWAWNDGVMSYINPDDLMSAATLCMARDGKDLVVDQVGLLTSDAVTGTLVSARYKFSSTNFPPRDEESKLLVFEPESKDVKDTTTSLIQ